MALALNMSLAELYHGRGTPMSLHEATVVWPAYYGYVARRDAEIAREQARQAERERKRI